MYHYQRKEGLNDFLFLGIGMKKFAKVCPVLGIGSQKFTKVSCLCSLCNWIAKVYKSFILRASPVLVFISLREAIKQT